MGSWKAPGLAGALRRKRLWEAFVYGSSQDLGTQSRMWKLSLVVQLLAFLGRSPVLQSESCSPSYQRLVEKVLDPSDSVVLDLNSILSYL